MSVEMNAFNRRPVINSIVKAILVTSLLSGCATVEKEPAPPIEAKVPEQWQGDLPKDNVAKDSIDIFKVGWLKTFNDPKLDKITDEVLKNNYDLKIAIARVEAATAEAKKAGADLLPTVNLGAQGGNSGDLGGNSSNSIGVGLDVSWELDVWGRIRAGRDAATSELFATQSDYKYARQSLVAQATKAYFLAIETKRQLELAEYYVANFRKTEEVTQAFFEEGMVSIQDTHIAKAQTATAEDALGNAKSAHLEALRSLELLLGRYPSAQSDVTNNLPALPEPVPTGVPSEILERRPDVSAAERRVAKAFSRVSEAKAAKLPKISLSGSFGGASDSLSNLTNPSSMMWNAASNLMFPVFNAGRLEADVEISTAQQKESMALYQKTALTAFSEVEAALANEVIFRKREKSLREAYTQAKRAEEIGLEKYQNGEGDLLDIQQLQRSTLSAHIALLRIQNDLLTQRVNLYLALGGNFEDISKPFILDKTTVSPSTTSN
jgi:NodT family efflux transporter outer membrane factor (OMF) lipoprotein